MISFWERAEWLHANTVIVGGGIIGISTAIECKTRHPEWRVLVLERGLIPTGASTRNAGFACFGSLSEIASDIDLMGATAAADLVDQRLQGLRLLAERCGDADIGYSEEGGSEIFLEHHPSLDRLEEVNQLLRPVLGRDAFVLRNDRIQEFGLSAKVETLVFTPMEGTLHSGKLMRLLWSIAQSIGVEIRTGAEVTSIDDEDSGVTLSVSGAVRPLTIKAEHVVCATNAMIPTLIPDKCADIVPGRGQVLVTEPIDNLRLRGSFHADEGYYYFRRLENRVLLGGARNVDFSAEQTTSHQTTEQIQHVLETMLRQTILPHHPDVRIDTRWAGTMAFTPKKQPRIQRVSPHVVVAFGCNGMGVAVSSTVARTAAQIIE